MKFQEIKVIAKKGNRDRQSQGNHPRLFHSAFLFAHIKDPKTATEASQMEMMDQMKKAYECITGEIGIPQPKEPFGKEKKKDEHGH